jgi:phosphoenolpyruvate carboxylase
MGNRWVTSGSRWALFEKEEEIRSLTKDLRQASSPEGEAAMTRVTEDLDLPTATQIIRAFTTFLQLVNVAEQIHDIRKLRYEQLVTPGVPRPGSLEHAGPPQGRRPPRSRPCSTSWTSHCAHHPPRRSGGDPGEDAAISRHSPP